LSALLLAVVMLLGASGWLPGTETAAERPFAAGTGIGRLPATVLEDASGEDEMALPPKASPRLNLHGDEVSPALATYSIDREGNLFEVHSPQTEEPRLGSPIG